MSTLNPLGLEWGTDSHAFSQIAEDYFMDLNGGGSILDPQSTCQLNYVMEVFMRALILDQLLKTLVKH